MILYCIMFFPKHFRDLTLRQSRIVPNNLYNPRRNQIFNGFIFSLGSLNFLNPPSSSFDEPCSKKGIRNAVKHLFPFPILK